MGGFQLVVAKRERSLRGNSMLFAEAARVVTEEGCVLKDKLGGEPPSVTIHEKDVFEAIRLSPLMSETCAKDIATAIDWAVKKADRAKQQSGGRT